MIGRVFRPWLEELKQRGANKIASANHHRLTAARLYEIHPLSASRRLWAAKKDLSQWLDLSADGKRFMIVENDPTDESPSTPVTFVLNFFDELRRLTR